MSKGFVFMLCMMMVQVCVSQTITVKDARSKAPLSYVNLYQKGTQVVVTNSLGKVDVAVLNTNDSIFMSRVGYYESVITPAELKENGSYYITQKVTAINEAVIEDEWKKVRPIEEVAKRELIPAGDIAFAAAPTSAEVLENTGQIMIQRSQLGGGSPILRGFEANKVLLVVDGVRMNNAIYRSGHLQNAITVDNNSLENVEVIFGPSSVLYGADALGGVVHYQTKSPQLAKSKGERVVSAGVLGKISSAFQEKSTNAHFMIGGHKFGSYTSFTFKEFGDLKMGQWRPHGDQNWGLVPEFVVRDEGVDQILPNTDASIQRGTGYSQIDFTQKLELHLSKKWQLGGSFQYSNSTDIPRFDRLNDYETLDDGTEQLRFAEWNYGPQKRLMTAVRARYVEYKNPLFNDVKLILAYQDVDESRINRRFGRSSRSVREENVKVYSLNGDLLKTINESSKLDYGVELTHNIVESNAHTIDIETGERGPEITRYPNGGGEMTSGAFYARYSNNLSEVLSMQVGARYSATSVKASFIADDVVALPFEDINIKSGAPTASVGLVYTPKNWRLSTGLSSGYRVPNLDDAGKVFEKDGFVIVPNEEVKPEFVYNVDLSLTRLLANERLKLNVDLFHTWLRNALVQQPYSLNGQETLVYEGEEAQIITNVNAGKAIIYGFSAGAKAELSKSFALEANFNYTYGQDLSNDTALAHIPPAFGRIWLQYFKNDLRLSFGSNFSEAKKLDRYGAGTADNLQEATPNGNPAWWTLNFKTAYQVTSAFNVQLDIENILDQHYKSFASGLSAPGRNFRLSLRFDI